MTTPANVSPLTWRTGLDHFSDRVYDSRGLQVAMARNADRAALIVRAVNNHERLVKALEAALATLVDDRIGTVNYMEGSQIYADFKDCAANIRAALAAAKEG